ncbi:MAG: tetratricopeptide repeat protein [Leptolyngbyaceae cyanobacterium CSU_1_4]|nr:tetratricopeptide repeat protein [Leptolyngbyaceae cyanobacterium CSU_1_4]
MNTNLAASLPGSLKDIRAMAGVLQHPEMGRFDRVDLLENPGRMDMERAIESIFSGGQPNDLILLYFSGHGIKEEDDSLYFATRETIFENGKLITTTAVETRIVQRFMSKSRSKQQVLILDCCFNGAFAEGMTARKLTPVPVDISGQLSAEGRAVLTSSTDTQSSFEDKDGGIYTRYIVEGIEKGAADTNNDGWITVDELHKFAQGKTQEAKPAMKPEIYTVREGYDIQLAMAKVDDPKVRYRKEVERLAKRQNGEFSALQLKGLDEQRKTLGLTDEKAENIRFEVLKPYREFEEKRQRYEHEWIEALQQETLLTDDKLEDIEYFRQSLGLRETDVEDIRTQYLAAIHESKHQTSPINVSINGSYISIPDDLIGRFMLLGLPLFIGLSAIWANYDFPYFPTTATDFVKRGDALVKKAKDYSWINSHYGQNLYDEQELLEAIGEYNQAIKKDPKSAEAYYKRGYARYLITSDKQIKQIAIEDFNKALELTPNYAEAYYARGGARYDLGDKKGAIDDFSKAISSNADYADAYFRRGLIKAELGAKQEAIRDFRQASELYQQQGNTGDYYERSREKILELQQ